MNAGGADDEDASIAGGDSPRARAKQKGAKPASNAADHSSKAEWRCVVTDTHKLIVWRDNVNNAIFNVEKDPYEMNNLWNQRAAAGLQKQLLERMKRWQKETGDPFPAQCKAAQKMYEKKG